MLRSDPAGVSRTRFLPLVCAALLLFGYGTFAGEGAGSHDDPNDAVAVARQFIATLSDHARSTVCFPFDAAHRRRWRRDPAPRPGLAIKDMTAEQRVLTDRMLATVLSDSGLAKVKGIMTEQDLMADEEGIGSGFYWLALFGEPGEGHWGWAYGGHHVSVHVTLDNTQPLAVTPLLLGGEMAGDPTKQWAGYERLRSRELLARDIANLLDDAAWRAARLDERAPEGLELSEPAMRPIGTDDRGLAGAQMTPGQRAALLRLVREYLEVFRAPIAAPYLDEFRRNADKFRFAWAGSRDVGHAHYYRVHGPDLLIEYWSSGAHMHTLLRADSDFGDSN